MLTEVSETVAIVVSEERVEVSPREDRADTVLLWIPLAEEEYVAALRAVEPLRATTLLVPDEEDVVALRAVEPLRATTLLVPDEVEELVLDLVPLRANFATDVLPEPVAARAKAEDVSGVDSALLEYKEVCIFSFINGRIVL